jgi:hypothetical protein
MTEWFPPVPQLTSFASSNPWIISGYSCAWNDVTLSQHRLTVRIKLISRILSNISLPANKGLHFTVGRWWKVETSMVRLEELRTRDKIHHTRLLTYSNEIGKSWNAVAVR